MKNNTEDFFADFDNDFPIERDLNTNIDIAESEDYFDSNNGDFEESAKKDDNKDKNHAQNIIQQEMLNFDGIDEIPEKSNDLDFFDIDNVEPIEINELYNQNNELEKTDSDTDEEITETDTLPLDNFEISDDDIVFDVEDFVDFFKDEKQINNKKTETGKKSYSKDTSKSSKKTEKKSDNQKNKNKNNQKKISSNNENKQKNSNSSSVKKDADSKSSHKNSSKKSKNSNTNNDKKKLKTIRSTQIFSPIRDVRDGIIITKDGHFVKIMEFSSINFMLRNEEEKDAIIADYMSVIKLLPTNAQFKIVCRKADVANFVDKIETDMRTELNANCRQLQREQISLIREVGSRQAISRRFFIIVRYENKSTTTTQHLEWENIVIYFNNIQSRIKSAMHRTENELLSTDDNEYTLQLLYELFCRNEAENTSFQDRLRSTVVRYMANTGAKKIPTYLPVNDIICPSYIDTKSSKFIVIDGLYYAFAYIPSKSYPSVAVAGWMNIFTNLGEGIDVDLFLKKTDTKSTQTKLQYAIRMNKLSLRSTEDTSLDYEEKIDTVNAGYYLKNGLASGDDFCYMNMLITVTERDEESLKAKCEELKQFCITTDIPLRMCDFQHEQAFISSLPLCNLDKNLFNKSKRNIMGNDFASTFPFSSYEVNDSDGILFGINHSNNSLVFVDNFDSNKYANANMAILGTSGAGKTFTMQCIALRMRQRKIQTFIIAPDKGHEFKRACDAIGGSYIKISPGSGQNINIMEIRPMDNNVSILLDGEDAQDSILMQKIQQLHVFFSLLMPDITHEEKQLLDEAFIDTYARFGITGDNETLWDPNNPKKYKEMPILSDLYETLEKGGERTQRLHTVLARYVTGSASSFNLKTNVDLNNKYIVLDVSKLTKEMLPIGMFIVLDYVWDKAREDRTQKKAIFIDEVWQLLGSAASEQSAEFVLEIFKVIRGYGGAAIAATQDLNDFFALEDGRYGKAVINNSKLKLIMKMEPKEAASVYEAMDLSDTELEEIPRFDRGEGILVANVNHVVVQVQASKHETDLITTKREDLARLAREKEEKEEEEEE